MTTYSFNTMPMLVVGTDRIATIHRRLAEQAAQPLPIRIVELPFRLPKDETACPMAQVPIAGRGSDLAARPYPRGGGTGIASAPAARGGGPLRADSAGWREERQG